MKSRRILREAFLFLSLCIGTLSIAQQAQVATGPMVGYSSMREVGLWVQTDQAAMVSFQYRPIDTEGAKWQTSSVVSTNEDAAHSAKVILTGLEPGLDYEARLLIDDKEIETYPIRFQTQALWQYRTSPPEFSFLAGSCFYINESTYDRPGKGYGQGTQILNAMHDEEADFMVWLGDNVYLREVDYDAKSGIYYRYTHTRRVPELTPLLATMHHYATWDDHDYGPNDSNRSYYGKKWTEDAFNAFWMNPTTDATGEGGITGSFIWADCEFFILDNRYHRSPEGIEGEQMLGEAQLQWLIEALKYSRASFKFIMVGSQVISDFARYENYANFEVERARLIELLDQNDIHGVVFLTGDRHSSEVSKMTTKRGNVFYDVTSSALTSKTYDHHKEANNFRMPGSMVIVNNYAVLDVSGELNERVLKVKFADREGETLYETTLDFPKRKRRY